MFDFSTNAKQKEAWLFLETVWQGLEYLCKRVERVERERAKPDNNFAYVDFGSSPGDAMVCNYFLWYASALYNFVGAFEKAFSPSEDLQDEFKKVIKWRHKVAAHTAWVWPRRDDNAATQDMSILLFPEFNFKFDGHFEVGGMRIGSPTAIGLPPTDDASYADWQWGLVRTHERLKEIVSKYAPAKMTDRSVSLLDDISTRGAEVRAQLRELLYQHEYACDTKTLVLVSYVDLALEHHEAIWLLRKSELTGSAFALVRPILDVLFRALWINAVATEQQAEQASRDELYFPPMHEMRDDIKERYSDKSSPNQAELFDTLLRRLKKAWKTASSYTHPGGLQIGRRFSYNEVKPNYSDGEISEALNLATVALLLLMRAFFMSIGCHKSAERTGMMLQQYSLDFVERLRAANTDENERKAK